jgi:hypothetical protein
MDGYKPFYRFRTAAKISDECDLKRLHKRRCTSVRPALQKRPVIASGEYFIG